MKNYPCRICNAPFGSSYLRTVHGKLVHPGKIVGRMYLCKVHGCGKELGNPRACGKHMRADHPTVPYAPISHKVSGNTATPPASASAYDRILEHKRGINAAMRDLDDERNQHMNRIKEIDDIIAKWTKFTSM